MSCVASLCWDRSRQENTLKKSDALWDVPFAAVYTPNFTVVLFAFQKMGEALRDNNTLQLLNIESNFVSGEGVIAILEGVNEHKALEELRVSNQVSILLSAQSSAIRYLSVEETAMIFVFFTSETASYWSEERNENCRLDSRKQDNQEVRNLLGNSIGPNQGARRYRTQQ